MSGPRIGNRSSVRSKVRRVSGRFQVHQRALADAAFWVNLEALDLACNWFREDGGVALADWPAGGISKFTIA